MFQSLFFRRAVTFIYFLFTLLLFLLPGSAFPKDDWMDAIYFDKWVHIGLFGLFVLLIKWSEIKAGRKDIILFIVLAVYGLAVELMQHYYVANRSFDVGDIWADLAGAAAGILFWRYIKK